LEEASEHETARHEGDIDKEESKFMHGIVRAAGAGAFERGPWWEGNRGVRMKASCDHKTDAEDRGQDDSDHAAAMCGKRQSQPYRSDEGEHAAHYEVCDLNTTTLPKAQEAQWDVDQ
jgi:hypothetical protein